MKKWLKILLPAAAVAVAGCAAVALAVAPGKSTEQQKAPFTRRNFAHRGLHKPDRSVPENSLAAFREAAEAGYGVELDVHLTADDEVVVFHDDTLERMCAEEGHIEDFSLAELRELRLAGTEEGIPTLREALKVIDRRGPVIVELKTGKRNRLLCEKTLEILDEYGGKTCIESFDPRIVRWFRKNAPDVLRGQLSCTSEQFGRDTSRAKAAILSRLLTNFLGRPQFVAYGICKKKPLTVRLCEALGVMRVAWTSHDLSHEEKNDAVIFEFYRPVRRY